MGLLGPDSIWVSQILWSKQPVHTLPNHKPKETRPINQRLKYEEQWAKFRYLNENLRTLTTIAQVICHHQSLAISHFISPEYSNTPEEQENDLRTKFMMIIEGFKEKMKKILKEIEEKTSSLACLHLADIPENKQSSAAGL